MSDDAASTATRQRTTGHWWFGPALLTAVILVVVGVQAVRQTTAEGPAAVCQAPITTRTDLPTTAVSVRLCEYGMPWDDAWTSAPPDALTEDVAAVIATYHHQSSNDPEACTADLGPQFALEFSYTGREPVRIIGALYGCHEIGGRYGAEAVLTSFLDGLAAQRAHQHPPQTVETPSCRGHELPWTFAVPRPEELSQGVLCLPTGDADAPFRQVTPDATDWATITADLVARSLPVDPLQSWDPGCPSRVRYLVGTDAYGSVLTVMIECNGEGAWAPSVTSRGATMRWQPSPATVALIDRLTR